MLRETAPPPRGQRAHYSPPAPAEMGDRAHKTLSTLFQLFISVQPTSAFGSCPENFSASLPMQDLQGPYASWARSGSTHSVSAHLFHPPSRRLTRDHLPTYGRTRTRDCVNSFTSSCPL